MKKVIDITRLEKPRPVKLLKPQPAIEGKKRTLFGLKSQKFTNLLSFRERLGD